MSCCCLSENTSCPFYVPKTTFYLSENNRHYFAHIAKIWAKWYSWVFDHTLGRATEKDIHRNSLLRAPELSVWRIFTEFHRLQVVSNFDDFGEKHTRAKLGSREETRHEGKRLPALVMRLLVGAHFRARACISPESPKLETTRCLWVSSFFFCSFTRKSNHSAVTYRSEVSQCGCQQRLKRNA